MATIKAGDVFTFNYTGAVQEWFPDRDCVVTISVYGAQGGSSNGTGTGGKGGYYTGTVNLKANEKLFINVGGQPSGATGGFNGGGTSNKPLGAGGGGATDVRVGSNSLYARLIVAGGGGGNCSTAYNGGIGGGLQGERGTSMGTDNQYSGNGGTQTSGGSGSGSLANGSFGQGGTGYSSFASDTDKTYAVGGGGGGWYGGSGGWYAYSGGSGGSGYALYDGSHKPDGYLLGSDYYITSRGYISGLWTGFGLAKITIVSVSAKPTKLEFSTQPKTDYLYGENFVTQGVLKVTYSDTTTKSFNLTSSMVSGFNSSIIGTQTLTVSYLGLTLNYNVIIHGVNVLYFSSDPKYIYDLNESFAQQGVVTAIWDFDRTDTFDLTSSLVSGFDTSTIGDKTLSLSYYNKTLTYDIFVRTIESVTLFDEPKLTYDLNEQFVEQGSLHVQYTDETGIIVPITTSMVTQFDTSKLGKSIVKLTHLGFNIQYPIGILIPKIHCVFDRTYEDLEVAYNNQHLGTNKGALYYSDLNRIESNINVIKLILDKLGYYSTLNIKTNWLETDIPNYNEMNRIRRNLNILVLKLLQLGIFDDFQTLKYLDYIEVNNWELVIHTMYTGCIEYEKQIKRCGEFFCGE